MQTVAIVHKLRYIVKHVKFATKINQEKKMKNITKNKKTILICIIVLSLFFVVAAKGSKLPIDLAKELQKYGYSTETQEQIIEAANNAESYYVRFSALALLKQRIGKQAIPTLKKALNDIEFEVRWRAAHFLGELGDKSGLGQMRKDLNKFAPNKGAPAPINPNITDMKEIENLKGKRNLCLFNASTAAWVLAKLGDRSGYELASRIALEGDWAIQRVEAIKCLIEISKMDKNILLNENLTPVSVLLAAAEKEKDIIVIETLAAGVLGLPDSETAIEILSTVKNAPNKSEKARQTAQVCLDLVKKRGN